MPPGFRWPDGVRAAACFTFDVDAESPILFEHPEAADWLDVMSHQAYGPRTGVPRLLRLLDRQGVRATFFVPGYTAERWPDTVRAIRDAGHEIGHHGYLHEGAHGASADEQERRLVRGLEALDAVLGVRPAGYRAPMWELTPDTLPLLAKHGFAYDAGLMDADHPYLLATSEAPGAAAIVELPGHWSLDDWEPYAYLPGITGSGVIASPDEVVGRWILELDGARRRGRAVHADQSPVRLGAGVAGGRARAADRTGEGDGRAVDRDRRGDRRAHGVARARTRRPPAAHRLVAHQGEDPVRSVSRSPHRLSAGRSLGRFASLFGTLSIHWARDPARKPAFGPPGVRISGSAAAVNAGRPSAVWRACDASIPVAENEIVRAAHGCGPKRATSRRSDVVVVRGTHGRCRKDRDPCAPRTREPDGRWPAAEP